ncbi:hypothetical protein ASE00_16115 [Sphingomonas sp. Root710]|uniref:alginate lyase family protein n=1 Tax=Sphingomonas sp. Root710 TaxID=1736594 RepID=UPI0006FD26DE|nr:alginate lyase family protein [Sphingomonas sp. Root710]KRB81494.1 hypothetical protein ASE00_16115 [Sphingomonas sp. Root710]
MIAQGSEGTALRFLNHAETIGETIPWSVCAAQPAMQLWRMHLHYMEFLEEASPAQTIDWMLQWIAANPPTRPGCWRDSWSPYTISIRTVVWMQQITRAAGQLTPEAEALIADSLAEQLRYLVDYLETDIGGNHLIKNIKALLWASSFFEGEEAARWRRLGITHLRQELDAQILRDGVHFERSLSYHAQVFADLLEIRSLPLSADDSADLDLDPRLSAMAQALADLTHPDGLAVLFNDSGLGMAYSPGPCLDAYARLTGERPMPRPVFSFPDAGYFGARSEHAYCVADCGPIAPDALPAHGHADVLSFELSLGGQRFIVDQAVFEYVAGSRRQASRSAASHNGLCLDGADQADFFGSFRAGRRPRITARAFDVRDPGFRLEGEHDGFANLRGAPIHQRVFLWGEGRLVIEDALLGHADRPGEIAFLLHPDVVAEGVSDREWRLRRDGTELILRGSGPMLLRPAVWWPDLGRELATSRLVLRAAPDQMRAGLRTELEWTVDA